MNNRSSIPAQDRPAYHAPEIRSLGAMSELTEAGTGEWGNYDGQGYTPSSTKLS